MDNTTAQKLKDAISKSNSIGVVVGANPSLDQMAAALSLYLFLKQTNKKLTIASPTNPLVEISSLVGINKVQNSLGGDAGDLVVSFPYVEGEIEKVSYTLEEGFLNIIVKAAEQGLSFEEKDVRYTRGSGNVDLLIVVGTPRLADLGGLFDPEKLRAARVINIDNKEENQRFGDVVIVAPEFSSLSEQIADLALVLGFQIDRDAAQNLLSGITHATRNFQDPRTSSLAFEMAALLMKRGAARERDDSSSSARSSAPTPPPAVAPTQSEDRPAMSYAQRLQQARQQQQVQQPVEQPKAPQQPAPQVAREQVDKDNTAEQNEAKPPIDWLSPKVYKGSSNF